MNRAQIVNDVFCLARAGYLNVTKPFELMDYLVNENANIAWKVVIDNLKYFIDILQSSEILKDFQAYLVEFINPIYKKFHEEENEDDDGANM